MNEYERESNEHQPIVVTINGAPTTTGFTVQDLPNGERPEKTPNDWVAPTILEGKPGVMTGGHRPGIRNVWIFVDGDVEQPVRVAGSYRIT